MEARAEFKYLRIPDRKIRVVMELVKGKKIDFAFNVLKFTNKRGAEIVYKLLRSAVDNISRKSGVNLDNLFVFSAYANQGPRFKKMHARAMGRSGMIQRKFSHACIIVSDAYVEKRKKAIKAAEKKTAVKTETTVEKKDSKKTGKKS